MPKKKVMFKDREYIIEFLPNGDISIDNEIFSAEIKQGINSIYKVDVNGYTFTIEVTKEDFLIDGEKAQLSIKPFIPISSKKITETSKSKIKLNAPIPGKISKILVKERDKVSKDQELLILEAMKMRNRIFSPCNGIIDKISIRENDDVEQDQLLIVIQP